MPVIPDIKTLQRDRAPSGVQSVARITPGKEGEGFQIAASLMREEADRLHRNQLSKAEADYLILQAEQDGAYDQDDDYGTIKERYTGAMEEGMGTIAATIGDAQAREDFVNRHRVDIVRGQERMSDLAWGKERDYERGQLTERLTTVREAGLNSDIGMANDSASMLIESATEMGYISEQERADMEAKFREGIAIGKLKMLEPEQQLEALSQDWAKNLPSDVRATLRRKAQESSIENKAHATARRILELPRSDAMDKIGQITNGREREETYKQYDYLKARDNLAKEERQVELYDKYADQIQKGEEVLDIAEDDWDEMDPKVRENLKNLQLAQVKPPKNSDPNVIYTLQLLRAQKAWSELRKYFRANSASLTFSDQKTWGAIDAEGNAPIEVNNKLTDTQALMAVLPDTSDKATRAALLGEIGEWRTNYIQNHNKEPDTAARDKAIARMMKDYYVEKPWYQFDIGGKFYEMDDEERQELKGAMQEENPELYQDTLNEFARRGITPTDAQIMDAYTKMRDAGGS